MDCVTSHFQLGAPSDSFYEYMLKQWVMSGKRDTVSLCWGAALDYLI
jgi:hypothetical protein